jgi:membrane protein DedA with SNARE-associated domain/rhodanese-related sulfurtransferase
MHSTVEIFLHYEYPILFLWVMLEQLGMPVPSTPILLTAGTLTATHGMRMHWVILAVLLGATAGDFVWFRLGGRYGNAVTRWICKFSLEAASCIRKTEDILTRHGAAGLLVAKFIPGLNTMAAPLAGQSKMPYRVFLLYDTIGTFFWASSLVLGGRFFGDAIRRNGIILHWVSRSAGVLILLIVAGLFLSRIVRQQLFLRRIRTLRIDPAELKAKLDRGEQPYIVDLRHPLDILPDPRMLPGAVRLQPSELLARNAEIPRDREVVLYCTCPSEATSARVALAMHRVGVSRIRPLRGGFDGWKNEGYPLVEIAGPGV